MRIAYVDGPRLRRALIAGMEHAQRSRAELNRINVFPVPDGDTGTNLSLTARAIADRLRHTDEASAGAVAMAAADAGVLGARGNCGMILSHYLLGFADAVDGRGRLSAADFSAAMTDAVRHLYAALEQPVEGTIITVMREVAETAAADGGRPADFADLVELLVDEGRTSLDRTPDLLPALRRAGVVDAGAKGFVAILEGVSRLVRGEDEPSSGNGDTPTAAGGQDAIAAAAAEFPGGSERYRYCTEALVRGDGLPPESAVRERLRATGDSLIVIRSGAALKVHVHTDEPDAVFAYLRGLGELVTHKAEDMAAQHRAVERSAAEHRVLARRPVGVVTDSACDLSDEILQAHGIQMVPLSLVFEDATLRDRVDVSPEEFGERLLGGAHPTTSQPPPAAFLEGFRRAGEAAENVVAVLLGSTLSGTYASAETAAKKAVGTPIHLVDSLGASLLQGLLTLRAAELAELATDPTEIVAELRRLRTRSGLLFTVETFDRLLSSGRVTRRRAWLGNVLGIRPILELNQEGRVEAVARARTRAVSARMIEMLRERIPADATRIRFGVIHVARPGAVLQASAALRAAFGDVEILGSTATPVIATHVGPGAWGVAWMAE